MPATEIPDPLPPAITLPREIIEFAINQDLAEFGERSLVARTWHWILHGGAPGPISRVNWSQFDGDGPPPKATLAAESTADQPPLPPAHRGPNSTKPGSTAGGAQPTPRTRFRSDSTPGTPHSNLDVPEEGSAAITMRESAHRLTPAVTQSMPYMLSRSRPVTRPHRWA